MKEHEIVLMLTEPELKTLISMCEHCLEAHNDILENDDSFAQYLSGLPFDEDDLVGIRRIAAAEKKKIEKIMWKISFNFSEDE